MHWQPVSKGFPQKKYDEVKRRELKGKCRNLLRNLCFLALPPPFATESNLARASPENQRQLSRKCSHSLLNGRNRLLTISGSCWLDRRGLVFPMDVAACAGDEAEPGCILRPPISATPKPQRPRRRRDPSASRAEFYAGRAQRWVWMQLLQYRRAKLAAAAEPGRSCCSRSLLGQSVTRQVGATAGGT